MKHYFLTTGTLFSLIAIFQALRLINQWPVQVGTMIVPLWPSSIAVIVATGLCIWAFRLALKRDLRQNGALP